MIKGNVVCFLCCNGRSYIWLTYNTNFIGSSFYNMFMLKQAIIMDVAKEGQLLWNTVYFVVWKPINILLSLFIFWSKTDAAQRPSWSWSYDSLIYNYLCNQCISPLKIWVQTPFMERCTRNNIMWYSLSENCDRSNRWFSPGTSVSPTNKTDRHDITEILLKVVLNTINLNQMIANQHST